MAFFKKSKLLKLQEKKEVLKKYTILLVDDEESNLEILSEMLGEEYNTLSARDGQEALELVQKGDETGNIHLILSDQRMPNLNGVEFLQKTLPLLPKTKRIIVSGFTDVYDIIDSINKSQIYKFILKPFDRQDILSTVKQALNEYEEEDQREQLVQKLERKLEEKEKMLEIFQQFVPEQILNQMQKE